MSPGGRTKISTSHGLAKKSLKKKKNKLWKSIYSTIYIYIPSFKACKAKQYCSELWINVGFPGGASGKESSCQSRKHKRCRFDPWVGKIAWSMKWQPTPVVLPGESHGQRSLAVIIHSFTELDTTEVTWHACMDG